MREVSVIAAQRRVRPCLMTSAASILTSIRRGSDIMIPMAIPSFGGMDIEVITMLLVPVLYR